MGTHGFQTFNHRGMVITSYNYPFFFGGGFKKNLHFSWVFWGVHRCFFTVTYISRKPKTKKTWEFSGMSTRSERTYRESFIYTTAQNLTAGNLKGFNMFQVAAVHCNHCHCGQLLMAGKVFRELLLLVTLWRLNQ